MKLTGRILTFIFFIFLHQVFQKIFFVKKEEILLLKLFIFEYSVLKFNYLSINFFNQ